MDGFDDIYYEIEYDTCPIPGVGKFVPKPQQIAAPKKDEIRDLFARMRELGRAHRSTYGYSRLFDRQIQQDKGEVFYKQGLFMQDFTDDYTNNVPFSQYYPYYQTMGYEQLRSYFTWRTKVRSGTVSETSLSYAFLYIYELLSNIGVSDPQDGLDRLMAFWKTFRVYHNTIDKYVLRWLKDYHIYYNLPQPFHAFIEAHDLAVHYPELAGSDDNFNLFCAISKYDIRKSGFFTEENEKLIADCFHFVADQLRQTCEAHSIPFEESIFHPTKKMTAWTPFQGALFYPHAEQVDRRLVLSKNEIYLCKQNRWTFCTVITSESGRQLIGYVMKQMESVLRKVMKYKHKLSTNLDTVTHDLVGKLRDTGISLETLVKQAVLVFYREATKTVVQVDPGALKVIRREALVTQEKLIIPEPTEQLRSTLIPVGATCGRPSAPTSDTSNSLRDMLSDIERQALSIALHGEMELKHFADNCGIMPEVLVDGINEKAMDHIGDSLLDEDFRLYDDYKEQVKELIE